MTPCDMFGNCKQLNLFKHSSLQAILIFCTPAKGQNIHYTSSFVRFSYCPFVFLREQSNTEQLSGRGQTNSVPFMLALHTTLFCSASEVLPPPQHLCEYIQKVRVEHATRSVVAT